MTKQQETIPALNDDSSTLAAILAKHDQLAVARHQMEEAEDKKLTPKSALERLEQSIKDSSEESDDSARLAAILGAYSENIVEREETYNEWRKARDYHKDVKEEFEQLFKDAKQGELPFEEDDDDGGAP